MGNRMLLLLHVGQTPLSHESSEITCGADSVGFRSQLCASAHAHSCLPPLMPTAVPPLMPTAVCLQVRASQLPISVIIVGVGRGDDGGFDKMDGADALRAVRDSVYGLQRCVLKMVMTLFEHVMAPLPLEIASSL